jgi:hypothetical protein
MVLQVGEKVHVIVRRRFDADLRRHFVGEVEGATEFVARVSGYAYVFDPSAGEYVRRPGLRARLFSLIDGGNIINIIPEDAKLENVVYKLSKQGRLVVTDDETFSLDVNEFGVNI